MPEKIKERIVYVDRPLSYYSIAGFVLSFLWFFSIFGIFLSIFSIIHCKKNNLRGTGLAIAGIIIGVIVFLFSVLFALPTYSTYESLLKEEINVEPGFYQYYVVTVPETSLVKVSFDYYESGEYEYLFLEKEEYDNYESNNDYYYLDLIENGDSSFEKEYDVYPGDYYVVLSSLENNSVLGEVDLSIATLL